MPESINLPPPPVFFIKSISEQGYSLSTAVADLVDNSVAAGARRVEILLDSTRQPLRLFIADNGSGMESDELTANMQFPSADLDLDRTGNDLGRFGLGLKTASFSQSRKFTVISHKNSTAYSGRTWDVDYLRETGSWSLIVNSPVDNADFLGDFARTSTDFHSHSEAFSVSTLVVWDNLYKLKRLAAKNDINDELEELGSHLGLVFHRYIQSGQLEIRLNNRLVDSFEPFPHHAPGVQTVAESFWQTGDAYIRFQGIILPKRSAAEAKEAASGWVPLHRTLEELQGIYVYRNGRLISYGGWLRAIPKSVSLQFGRIRIDISNTNDSEFHLNVAKSSLKIPFGLKRAMTEMVGYVASQALKEYRERMASGVIRTASVSKGLSLLIRETTAAGARLKINGDFELLRKLQLQLNPEQDQLLQSLLTILENKLNNIWQGEVNPVEIEGTEAALPLEKIKKLKAFYEESDYSWEEIRELLLDSFGKSVETQKYIDSLHN